MLHDAVKPGGRVLIQQMSRAGGRKGHPEGGPFIESFIAPDMQMRPFGETVAFLERGGLEVRDVHAMREHYVRTVAVDQILMVRPGRTRPARWPGAAGRLGDRGDRRRFS